MAKRDRRILLKGTAVVGMAAMATFIAFAADVVPSGPSAAEADASIAPARTYDVVSCLEARVGSFADSVPGRINSNEPCGFTLILR